MVKKLISFLMAFMMVFGYTTVLAEAVELLSDDVITILEESTERNVVISSNVAVTGATLYVAAYKDDILVGVVSKPVDIISGKNNFEMTPTWNLADRDYVKIYLWDKAFAPYAERVITKTPTLYAETVYANDNEAKIEISLLNNPGISSLMFDIEYDNFIKLTAVDLNEDFTEFLTTAEPFTNPQTISMISPFEDIYKTGVIATLTFDTADVPEGEDFADINIVCDNGNTFNADFDSVEFKVVNGKVIFDKAISTFECNEDESGLMEIEPMTLSVEKTSGLPGSTVTVDFELSNNTGVASLLFEVEYDDVLTLESVDFNEAFAGYSAASTPYRNPQTINFISPFKDVTVNGTFATLTFRISDTAENNYVANIKLLYNEDDIFNSDYNSVLLNTISGSVTVYEGVPGDINSDGIVNNKDAITLFRYIADKDSAVVETNAVDVTGDGKLNNWDAIQIFRFVAKWPNVKLVRGSVCEHKLLETAKKAPTCTETGNDTYWQCEKCKKYYSDAKATNLIDVADTVIQATGHSIITLPAVDPTPTESGLTEGKKCANCDYYELKQEEIPPLGPKNHNIKYILTDNDSYLESIKDTIVNPNPDRFSEYEDLVLKDASVTGYNFEGWYNGTGSNANRVTKIEKGTTEDITLYAKWEIAKNSSYTVHFVSDGSAFNVLYDGAYVSSITYPMTRKLVVPKGEMKGYIFLCWTDSKGNIVESIEPGSRGDITLTAHWTSERNQTRPVKELGSPVILKDDNDEVIYFIYELGDIINVPLEVVEDFGNGEDIVCESRIVKLKTVKATTAQTVAESVSNATTKSSLITLSDEWNEGLSMSNEQAQGVTTEDIETIKNRVDNGGAWNISSYNGGSTAYTINSGSSQSEKHLKTTASIESENIYDRNFEQHEDSTDVYIGSTEKASTEKKHEFSVGLNSKMSNKISAELPVPGVDIGAEVGLESGVNLGYKYGRTTYDETGSYEDKVDSKYSFEEDEVCTETSNVNTSGTEDYNESHAYTDISKAETASWNTQKGYQQSHNISDETAVTSAISKIINEKFGYYSTKDHTNGKSTTSSSTNTSEQTREYTSMVEYSIEEQTETMTSYALTKKYPGYLRLVEAGTIHVFGVVGYDIKNSSYFTYTYNVLDSKTNLFYDHSIDDPNYSDRENGVLPFEIPIAVNKYVATMIAKTEGIEIDDQTGIVTAYEGTAKNVLIPNYVSVADDEHTRRAVKVTGFESDVFRGKAVETVMLSEFIAEIPNEAFMGCTNLKTVISPAVTKIGKDAFKGCNELSKFNVSALVTDIGEGAFSGVPEVEVYAATPEIVKTIAECGATKISIYLKDMVGELKDCTINVKDTTTDFAFYGAGKSFENVNIVVSNGTNVTINRATFNYSGNIALKLKTQNLTLSNVTVNSAGIALLLENDSTAIRLDKHSYLTSNTGNSLVTKNVSLTKTVGLASDLNVEGKMLMCGSTDFAGKELVNATEGILEITQTQFNNITTFKTVTFNSNDGSNVESQTIICGDKVIKPADPVKNRYKFLGWYTDSALTTAWNFDAPVTEDMILYAAWELSEFTITFNANGGSCSATTKNVYAGEAVGTLPTPTRTHYTFAGWYTEGGEQYTESTVYNEIANITLVAKWNIVKYTATWSAGTGTTITVNRTSSPNAKASTGTLSSGAPVYYGDVLSITYAAKTGYTLKTKGSTSITVAGNVTSSNIYATATVNSYTATWSAGTGTTITVKRTSSPLQGAKTGDVSSGATVYYGDVLSVTYKAKTGYTLSTKGATSITVKGNVTSSNIYATATANEYTYDIVYKSSNGTQLGTGSIKKVFNTTNEVTAKSFEGYITPEAQTVTWNSTEKTITFTYTPETVANKTSVKTGVWWNHEGVNAITYEVKVEYRNRTKDSIQLKMIWYNNLKAKYIYGFNQWFYVNFNGETLKKNYYIAEATEWISSSTVLRTAKKESDWITVPVSPTTNKVDYAADWVDDSTTGRSGSISGSVKIPTY